MQMKYFKYQLMSNPKLIKTFAIADTVSSSPRIIELDAESGKIIWEWRIPNEYLKSHNKSRPMCAGAGLTLENDKSINALIPHFGVVNVNKNGDHKVLITDDNIDHAAQQLGVFQSWCSHDKHSSAVIRNARVGVL